MRSPADAAFGRRTSHAWYYLTAAEVTGSTSSLMVFGDSLMDGVGTSPGTDNRFSDKLVERLIAAGRTQGMTNAGLAGDRLLHDSPVTARRASPASSGNCANELPCARSSSTSARTTCPARGTATRAPRAARRSPPAS